MRRESKIHLPALAERRVIRKHNSSFISFHHCLPLFRGTNTHRSHVLLNNVDWWFYGASTLQQDPYQHIAPRRAAETPKLVCASPSWLSCVSIWEHLMGLSLQYIYEIRNYPWDDSMFSCLFYYSHILLQNCQRYQHKARKQKHSKCSRNCLNTWTVQERTSEQIDVLEKNKQKKQSKTLHYITLHVMKHLEYCNVI